MSKVQYHHYRQYFDLRRTSRLLLGPMVPQEQATLLRKALSDLIEIVRWISTRCR